MEPQERAGHDQDVQLSPDTSGATAMKQPHAGISVAIITVVGSLGSSLNTTFTSVQTAVK
jgi:hypothetical protein